MKPQIRFLPAIAIVLLLVFCTIGADGQEQASPEIHCKHFFYGYPVGVPLTNDMIIREIYALSSNDATKIADWVVYRLDRKTIEGDVRTSRVWKADPWLDEDETLEPSDYDGANAALKTDRGHQAPLASFKGTDYWKETNFLSNITPQKSSLNQGPWQVLESKVRDLVEGGYIAYVMTGPLFEKEMPSLPNADEPHTIPSGYWKIVCVQESAIPSSIKAASFILDQETKRNAKVITHLTTIDSVEVRSGLDFLWELPDDVEDTIEEDRFEEWARRYFD